MQIGAQRPRRGAHLSRAVFQDRAHNLLRRSGANYIDANTGLEYWVSAPKKRTDKIVTGQAGATSASNPTWLMSSGEIFEVVNRLRTTLWPVEPKGQIVWLPVCCAA